MKPISERFQESESNSLGYDEPGSARRSAVRDRISAANLRQPLQAAVRDLARGDDDLTHSVLVDQLARSIDPAQHRPPADLGPGLARVVVQEPDRDSPPQWRRCR